MRQRKGYCSGRTCLEGWSCLNVLGLIFNYFLILQLLYSPYLDVFAILYTLYTLYYLQLFPIKHSMTVLCFRCRCGQCWRSTTCNMCSCPKRYILKKFFYLILRVCATISLILYTLTPFRLKRDYLVYFKYLCYSAFFSYFTDIVLGSFFWLRNFCFRQRKGYCSVRTCSKTQEFNLSWYIGSECILFFYIAITVFLLSICLCYTVCSMCSFF